MNAPRSGGRVSIRRAELTAAAATDGRITVAVPGAVAALVSRYGGCQAAHGC